MLGINGTSKLLKRIMGVPASLKDLVDKDYNLLIDDLNNILGSISFSRNFESQLVKDVSVKAGQTVRVSHKLQIEPSFRIVVRQTGNGNIEDGAYTDTFIELKNSGANDILVSILLFKE